MSYRRKADLLAGTSGVKAAKFVANNTLDIQYEDGREAIRLHDTDVITRKPNGDIVLNSGGWRTLTTKDRINRFQCMLSVYQENHVWYVVAAPQPRIVFYDGITFDAGGRLKSARINGDEKKRIESMKRKIAKLVKKIDEAEKLPTPGPGDCWFCGMITQSGKSWGEETGDIAHLIAHVDQLYLHGSLLLCALKHKGYRDHQFPFVWNMKGIQKRALRSYLYDKVLFPKGGTA